VEEGTVLAQIDEALYQADVAQAEAQLGQAGAALEKAQADLVQLQAKYSQAERDWGRPASSVRRMRSHRLPMMRPCRPTKLPVPM